MRFWRRVLVLPSVVATVSCSAPTRPSPSENGSAVVFVGAGDIGWCGSDGPEATARLLDRIVGTVFTTGDNAYPDGRGADFSECYAPTWGRHKARTRPSPGNHDYLSPEADPYFSYFGDNAGPRGLGYYSFNLGAWHIVSLNSNIPMTAGSVQEVWLRADLATNPTPCALAYWHHPLFSSGRHGSDSRSVDIWRTLDDLEVDIVVNGHDHMYERFAPQTASGGRDDRAIRQFTVGTGGAPLYDFFMVLANSEVRHNRSFGVLKLTLRSRAYDWEFLSVDQAMVDTGSASCIQ